MAILIIDDSSDSRLLIKSILVRRGFSDIMTAASAQEVYLLLEEEESKSKLSSIDLILMDVIMPDIDGIEACRYLKSNKYFQDIPIIMVTASTDIETLDRAFVAGAIDYIIKPVNQHELIARVNSALRIKRETDRRKAREAELVQVLEQLEAANRELKRLSSLDGLTGIANRRHFDEIYEIEWRRAVRKGYDLSIVFLDIDFFKLYNDTYGHQVGDECLKRVAGAVAAVLKRPGDSVARYGGEEFVVVLPDTGLEGAQLVAEQIRGAVEALGIPHRASKIAKHVTISVGLCCITPTVEDNPQELVKQADMALYEAKSSGRNCVKARLLASASNITPK